MYRFAFALLLLGACTSTQTLSSDGTNAPGVARNAEAIVDPLIVGDRLLASGEPELALQHYIRSAGDAGLSPALLVSMSTANIRLGRLQQAERQLQDVLKQDPSHVGALNNYGVLLMEREEYGEASRTFRKAFALDNGSSPEIRENLRVALAKLENTSYSDESTGFTLVPRGNGIVSLTQDP